MKKNKPTKKKKSKAIKSKPVKPIKAKPIKAKPIKAKPIKAKPIKPSKKSKAKSKPTKNGKSKPRVSRDLRDFLKDQGITYKEFIGKSKKLQRELEKEFKEESVNQGDAGEWYYPDSKTLRRDYPGAKVASYRHADYESALKWWQGVTGGADYFVIVRRQSSKTGRAIYFVMDIDPNRKRKGTSKKVSNYQSDRALKLEQKYLETEDYK